jgi:predicted nucleic acid-binding protein
MTTIVAVLDANVLFPASLRDTLVRANERGFYQMQWTLEILEEVRRNLVKTNRVTEEKAQRLINTLMAVFPQALVNENYRRHIPLLQNDPKDRHVLAAAIECQAQVIITSNVQDFPSEALLPYGIEVRTPDAFLISLFDDYPAAIIRLIMDQAANLHNPPKSLLQEIGNLAIHVPTFAQALREFLAEFPQTQEGI